MIIGLPREVKQDEYRIALLPVGVEELVRRGYQVLVEQNAGLGSGKTALSPFDLPLCPLWKRSDSQPISNVH